LEKQAQEGKAPSCRAGTKKGGSNSSTSAPARPKAPHPRFRPTARELPPASFATLVNTLVTQSLFYLGDLQLRAASRW